MSKARPQRGKFGIRRFTAYFDALMTSRSYSAGSLLRAMGMQPRRDLEATIVAWRAGRSGPRRGRYLKLVEMIEAHFGLPIGRLSNLLSCSSSEIYRRTMTRFRALHCIVRWHLPEDFDSRTEAERQEILDWLTVHVLPCNTEYGKYLRKSAFLRYGLSLPDIPVPLGGHKLGSSVRKATRAGNIPAPASVAKEILDMAKFKTAPLPPTGYLRHRAWRHPTTRSDIRRCASVLGLLAAPPEGSAQGLGVPPEHLTLGLLVFPSLWDWFLQWNLDRRGFFTHSETLALITAKALTRPQTGWLRQHPELTSRLTSVEGLVGASDISRAKKDWERACDQCFEHAQARMKELSFSVRMHRDPFAAILPVLTNDNPLGLYKRIGNEILRHMPDEKRFPTAAATSVRDYLIFRLALHLGVRSRNLRELLICSPGQKPHSTSSLQQLRRGELRWNPAQRSWEVEIPAIAFKNGTSAFFRGRPFQITLPDLEGLYGWIERYLKTHRPHLLDGLRDPGTFLIRARRYGVAPSYDEHSFHQMWRTIIYKYGIYNPYTQRGAIKGLLAHGPHTVRAVLATHLLKKTGSYELASYAIQDSVSEVMKTYGRFLPQEKVARAAEVLNKVWRQ